MPRPRLHDAALRVRLLEVASRVVSTAGTDALTVRDVAREAGTSASAVYALFGSREDLVRAVGDEAFRRFAGHLAAVERTDDPRADLLALGLAYRTSALADPHFYRVMFDTAGAGARAATAPRATAMPTFLVLREAVRRVLDDAGRPPAGTEAEIAMTLWGLVHGLVSLELAGLASGTPAQRSDRYLRALATAGAATLAGGGDDVDGR